MNDWIFRVVIYINNRGKIYVYTNFSALFTHFITQLID